MKKLGLLLLLASSSALAGGAGKPPSEMELLNHFHDALSRYAIKNKASLPEFTDCLKGISRLPVKPANLRLTSCGIANEKGHLFLDVSTASFGLLSTPEPYLLGNTARQQAETTITVNFEQYKLRQVLGQPLPDLCGAAIATKNACRVKTVNGNIERFYYESKDGIRLIYDGNTFQDWPKE